MNAVFVRRTGWGGRIALAVLSLAFALECASAAGNVADSQGVEGKPVAKASTPVGPVAVKFDKLEIKTAATTGVGVVDLDYDFTNTSDFPLAVEGFVQSCGCMAGEWDGTPVKPGERGSVELGPYDDKTYASTATWSNHDGIMDYSGGREGELLKYSKTFDKLELSVVYYDTKKSDIDIVPVFEDSKNGLFSKIYG